ncbi:hypothetical protein Bca101_019615 [Brassica carinata]
MFLIPLARYTLQCVLIFLEVVFLRVWEAVNVKGGAKLMGVDMLLSDAKIVSALDGYTTFCLLRGLFEHQHVFNLASTTQNLTVQPEFS